MDEEGVDWRAVLAKLVAHRWWIVVSVILFSAMTSAAALLTTPTYRATVVLIAADLAGGSNVSDSILGQFGGLASLAGITGSNNALTEEALAVLRSRQFTESFIKDKDLMPTLFEDKWDATQNKWRGDPAEWPTPAKANKYFNNEIRTIVSDKKSGLTSLHIDWKDRVEAASWANELVSRLNEEMRDRAIRQAEASVGFLEKELQSTINVSTREAIGRLVEAQIKQRMLANVTQEYAFRVVDPALPPDVDDPEKPKKIQLIIAGPILGLAFGVMLVLVVGRSATAGRRQIAAASASSSSSVRNSSG